MMKPDDKPAEGKISDDEEPNVSQEEQDAYDLVMLQAQASIYNEQGMQSILQKFGSMKDKMPLAVGHTAAMIMRSVRGGLKEAGKEVPDDVIFHAGADIVADLAELATAAKLSPEGDEAKLVQEALFEGLKVFGDMEIQSGELTPERQKKAQSELDGAKEFAPVAAAMRAGLVGEAPPSQPQPPPPQGGGLLEQGA